MGKILKRIDAADIEIVEVKNCFIIKWNVVRTFFRLVSASLLKEMSYNSRLKLWFFSFFSFFKNSFSIQKGDNFYFICNFWSNGYYHWVAEIWKKLIFFNDELKSGTVLISKFSPQYIRDSLDLFGIKNIKEFNGNCFVKKVRIISNSIPRSPNLEETKAIRTFFSVPEISTRENQESDKCERIYITRRVARARKVTNEDEVLEAIKDFEFTCLELESITLKDQINIFKKCKVLLSIHGAGLVNAILMPIRSNVIEFTSGINSGSKDTFLTLCNTIGIHHTFIKCDRTDKEKKGDFYQDNLTVNIARLRTTLEKILNITEKE